MAVFAAKLRNLAVAMQKNYTCSICLGIFSHPIVTKCKHQFCRECSQNLLKQPPPISCPLCKTRLSKRSFSETPFVGEVARAVQQVVAAIKEDDPHAQISPPKGPSEPNEFDDPASQSSDVIVIPETENVKMKSRKRGRNNKETDIGHDSKRPNLQHGFPVYAEKSKEPSVTVEKVPITNTNIRSGFPHTRSNRKAESGQASKPYLRHSKPLDVASRKKAAITGCQIVAETCPIRGEKVADVIKDVLITMKSAEVVDEIGQIGKGSVGDRKKEVATKREEVTEKEKDNGQDLDDDILVSVSQVSPQDFRPSRTVTSRMLSMVTGQTQSPRTKVFSWLEKAINERDHQDAPSKTEVKDTARNTDVEDKRLEMDPYEFISSQRCTPRYGVKKAAKKKRQPRRNYSGAIKKPFNRCGTAIQNLSAKYVYNARNLRSRNRSCNSHFYSTVRDQSPSLMSPKPESKLDTVDVDSLDSPIPDTFDALVVEHNRTISHDIDLSKIEEKKEEDTDAYALFVTPKCPAGLTSSTPWSSSAQKQKISTKKRRALTSGRRAGKVSELENILAELEEVNRFTLNVSSRKNNEEKAEVMPAAKATEKIEGELMPKEGPAANLRSNNFKPKPLSKEVAKKKEDKRMAFEFFTAGDEIVDITVSHSDDEPSSKENALPRKKSVSPKKKGSNSSEGEWRRISQLNRDFYSKRRKSCGDENAQIGDKSDVKSELQPASKSALMQNPSQRSTESCNLIGLDNDDNFMETLQPGNNLPDIDLQNIALTSADNVVITDAKHASIESIEAPPSGETHCPDVDKHDLPVITDKLPQAQDEVQNAKGVKPFKCSFTKRGKLEFTLQEQTELYLCAKCKSCGISENSGTEEKCQVEPTSTGLKILDSNTDEDDDDDDDENQAVLMTRDTVSSESPVREDQNILTSPHCDESPAKTQNQQIDGYVVNQDEISQNSQTILPMETTENEMPLSCGQRQSQRTGQTNVEDKLKRKLALENKENSQKSLLTKEDFHFDSWNSWIVENEENAGKSQASIGDQNENGDENEEQDVAIFIGSDEKVGQNAAQKNTKPQSQHCGPKTIANTQRSTPPRVALAAQSPKSNHVGEKEKSQRTPVRKFCRIKPPVDSDTDSSEEHGETKKPSYLETAHLDGKEWSDYIRTKYCNKSDSQSWKVTRDPPSEVILPQPAVIDLDDCSQSGESLFGSEADNFTTHSQMTRNAMENLRKDMELSYSTGQISQASVGFGQKMQLQQSPESNPVGEKKKEKDEVQDRALSARENVTTDRNPAARQEDSASSHDAGDDGSSIFLVDGEDLQEDGFGGIVASQNVQCSTQARMQLENQVVSLEKKIKYLEEQLKAKK